ncbi:hypothetical protein P8452_61119 [Trifolium repens]|nr:hypothetical protein P8452_61119 [Trifolium repens]
MFAFSPCLVHLEPTCVALINSFALRLKRDNVLEKWCSRPEDCKLVQKVYISKTEIGKGGSRLSSKIAILQCGC